MNCLNCGGLLIMRLITDCPLDENGVYDSSFTVHQHKRVVCGTCMAVHMYEELHESGDLRTIALVANSDPVPHTTVAIGFRGGVVDDIGADTFVGLIVIDEDEQQVGRFRATPEAGDTWYERAKALNDSIKKGEWQANFAEGREDAPDTN